MKLKKKAVSPKQGDLLQKKRFGKKIKELKRIANDIEDDDEDEDEDSSKNISESIFKQYTDKLKSIEKSATPEQYDLECLKALRALVLDLIPVAEDNYRKYPLHTNASAVVNLIGQETSLIADERALTDYQARAERLIDVVVKEYEDYLAKDFIKQCLVLKEELSNKSARNSGDVVHMFMKEFSKTLTESRGRLASTIRLMLVSAEEPKRRKKRDV